MDVIVAAALIAVGIVVSGGALCARELGTQP